MRDDIARSNETNCPAGQARRLPYFLLQTSAQGIWGKPYGVHPGPSGELHPIVGKTIFRQVVSFPETKGWREVVGGML